MSEVRRDLGCESFSQTKMSWILTESLETVTNDF